MSRRTQILLAGVAAAALTATGVTAYAQAKPDPAPKRVEREVRIERDGADVRIERDGKTVVIRNGDHAQMGRDHAEHLKAILQLRPNQDAALTAYLEAMKPKERTIRVDSDDEDGKTTPERLARMEQRLNERQAEQRAHIEATRRFYGQLDGAQKRAFDELPPMMGGMGGEVRVFRTMHRGGPMPGFHEHGFDHAMPPMPPVPPAPPAPPSL